MTQTTLDDLARRHATERGGKVALRDSSGDALTYAELERRACRVANALIAAGVARGQRVAWLGKNTLTYFEYLLGAAKAGAVMVPMNWRFAAPEIEYLVQDSQAPLVIVEPEFSAKLESSAAGRRILVAGGPQDAYVAWRDAAPSTDPDRRGSAADAVLQLYTSGTTGRPKGAVLTNASLFGLRAAMADRIPPWYRWSADDVSLIAMPVAHISGTGWGLWTLQHGATGVVAREFDPHAIFDLLTKHRISKIMMVPTAMQIAVRHPGARTADFSFLSYIYYGGSPIPPDLLRECMAVFGCGFVQMYGMTETSGTIVALAPEDHGGTGGDHSGSVGRALPGVELKIVDSVGRELPVGESGEIATRSIANMAGYYNRPDATAETIDADGWLRTGDAGFVDTGGYVHLRDRVKDMIISGGENVYPVEVENALRGHPEVADVAVIGVADDKWGERVVAVIVPKAGTTPTRDSIVAWSRERIAAYKSPKTVEFVAELPRNASGKVLRRELRVQFRATPK
jgi:acyl-CoA synthetase (AMP-forming)/AMP-acid ligase II